MFVIRDSLFFFFQAEDGIRGATVTGVQTCALPIYARELRRSSADPPGGAPQFARIQAPERAYKRWWPDPVHLATYRSEERRVGQKSSTFHSNIAEYNDLRTNQQNLTTYLNHLNYVN